MIEFLNEDVRREFHLLPLERQKSITEWAEFVEKRGEVLKVLYVEIVDERISEISIRVDKKFNNT